MSLDQKNRRTEINIFSLDQLCGFAFLIFSNLCIFYCLFISGCAYVSTKNNLIGTYEGFRSAYKALAIVLCKHIIIYATCARRYFFFILFQNKKIKYRFLFITFFEVSIYIYINIYVSHKIEIAKTIICRCCLLIVEARGGYFFNRAKLPKKPIIYMSVFYVAKLMLPI